MTELERLKLLTEIAKKFEGYSPSSVGPQKNVKVQGLKTSASAGTEVGKRPARTRVKAYGLIK